MLAIAPDPRRRIPGGTASIPATGAMTFTSMMDRRDAARCRFGAHDPTDAGDVGQDVDPVEFHLQLFEQADERRGVREIAEPVGGLRTVPCASLDQGRAAPPGAPRRSPPPRPRRGPPPVDDRGPRRPRSRRRPSPVVPRRPSASPWHRHNRTERPSGTTGPATMEGVRAVGGVRAPAPPGGTRSRRRMCSSRESIGDGGFRHHR